MLAAGRPTATEAQDFDMISKLRSRQCQQGGCEKHGLIVGMCDEQQYALPLQCRERAGEL